jgi:sulfatase modifying factor 1
MIKSNQKIIINKAEVTFSLTHLCWIRDFTYSYNEPQTRNYFWHPAFDDYPVVGVSWKQATAFCHWRTKLWNQFKAGRTKY